MKPALDLLEEMSLRLQGVLDKRESSLSERQLATDLLTSVEGLKTLFVKPLDSFKNPLSVKETEVLGHVSRGFTNKEIASALSVSSKTIEYHLSQIYRKLEVSGRAEAVKRASEMHLNL